MSNLISEYTTNIHKPIVFNSKLETVELELEKIIARKSHKEWSSFRLILITDYGTCKKLEENAFFHNTPQNRLDIVEGGFNPDLKVRFEIALERTHFHLLPDLDVNLESFFQNLSRNTPLGNEDVWKAHLVWTETPLGESLGGGVIKVGYETIFSKPVDRIAALKRQGPVTEAIITALIEGSMPVDFDDASQSFKLRLKLQSNTYQVDIQADNENSGLTLKVIHPLEISTERKERVIKLADQFNQEISMGEFSISDEQLGYFHRIMVSQELMSFQWVSETLLAGVSLAHDYSPQLEALLKADP